MSLTNKIEVTGKIAKFPKGTKAVNALEYFEKIKVNPNKIWYILVESQSDQLKMVKYNRCKGVDLLDYCAQLKQYYRSKFKLDKEILEQLDQIDVIGEQDFSILKNIPNLTIEGQSLISKITNDLIKLLAD